jgi:hypothetical protein
MGICVSKFVYSVKQGRESKLYMILSGRLCEVVWFGLKIEPIASIDDINCKTLFR